MFYLFNFFIVMIFASIAVFFYLSNDSTYILFGFFAVMFLISTILSIKRKKESDKELREADDYEQFLNENGFEYNENPDNKMYEKELELCMEYLEKNPANEHALKRKGTLFFNLGKYSDAMNIYKIILDRHKDNFSYTIDYAKCFYALGNEVKAFEIINKFYANKEKDCSYYSGLSCMYVSLREYNAALENINRAIELAPDLFVYYSERAFIYKKLNRLAEYEADMNKYSETIEAFNKKYGIKTNNSTDISKNIKNDFKHLKP